MLQTPRTNWMSLSATSSTNFRWALVSKAYQIVGRTKAESIGSVTKTQNYAFAVFCVLKPSWSAWEAVGQSYPSALCFRCFVSSVSNMLLDLSKITSRIVSVYLKILLLGQELEKRNGSVLRRCLKQRNQKPHHGHLALLSRMVLPCRPFLF